MSSSSDFRNPLSRVAFDGLVITVTLVVMGVAARALVYAFENDSGHTGANPYVLWMGSIPALILAVEAWLTSRRDRSRTAARALGVAAAFTTLMPVYFQYTRVLQNHGLWVRNDMPMVPENRILLLILFNVFFSIAMILSVAFSVKGRRLMAKHEKGGTNAPFP